MPSITLRKNSGAPNLSFGGKVYRFNKSNRECKVDDPKEAKALVRAHGDVEIVVRPEKPAADPAPDAKGKAEEPAKASEKAEAKK